MKLKRYTLLRFVALFLSIVFAFGGITVLRQGAIAAGMVVTIIAATLFVVLVILNGKHPLSGEEALSYRPFLIQSLFWISSIIIMILVVNAMSDWGRSASVNYWISFGWFVSLLCVVIGMLFSINWHPDLKRFFEKIKRNRDELIVISCLLLVGLVLRIYDLGDHPFPWSGDEASIGIEGERIISGEVTDFFESGWSGQPNWSFIPTTISLLILGKSIFAVRLVSALQGTLSILFLYLLARELFGRMVATLAAGFLVAFTYHLQFSRIGVNNIIDSLTVCFVLWLTLRAIRKGQIHDYCWAGLSGGLAFYTYVGSRLVFALAVFVLLYTVFCQRGYLRDQFIHIGIFFGSAIMAITPLAYYFIHHPDVFMTRMGQESIFLNHWLVNTSERTGTSIPTIIWKQFIDTVLVFIAKPPVGNFFNSSEPYLSVLGSIFFVFGMVYAVMKISEPRMVTVLVWFWVVIFLGGVFTLSPPANTRLTMTTPAVAIFLALGICQFLGILNLMKLLSHRWQTIFGFCLLALLGIQNVAYYFGIYRDQNYFQDATGEFAQEFGLELKILGPDFDYYLFGLPRIFAAFPTIVFLCPENGMFDITNESVYTLDLTLGKSNIFVAIPENRSDLKLIESKYPGGTWEEVGRRYKNEVLYFAYILP